MDVSYTTIPNKNNTDNPSEVTVTNKNNIRQSEPITNDKLVTNINYNHPSNMNPLVINKRDVTASSPTGFSRKPLLSHSSPNAPLALSETEDDLDDREVVSKPYPGVDDGFFSNGDDEKKPNNDDEHPEVEFIPTNKPKEPEEPSPDEPPSTDVVPIIPRMGPDGDDNHPTDEGDGKPSIVPKRSGPGIFPYAPGYGHGGVFEVELGSNPDFPESIPDLNVYQHKKTLAQGMMDLALFSANANQLRYVMESFPRHPYFYPSLTLISISLILQIAVGIGLIWNATLNVKNDRALCLANKINNFTVVGIFLVTVINVFISAFGVSTGAAPAT